MKTIGPVPAVLAAALVVTACTTRTVIVRDEPAPRASTAATLGVPPGHLPRPGMCRVWIPGRPPGRQAKARSCGGILAAAPPGAWVLYRPDGDRRLVHVRHMHEQRAGVVVRVRVFEAQSGKHVRDDTP